MKPHLLFIRHHVLSILIISMLLSSCYRVKEVQHFTIDEAASAMEWKGYQKDGSCNNGTIKVTGKLIAAERGEITGGQIKLPLSSLININLPTDELKNQLIHHLQSKDFFNKAIYPYIIFQITSLIPDKDLPHTYHATGGLTLLGTTHRVSFPVTIKLHENRLEVTGETSIDRTLWGMSYASDENAGNGMYVRPGIDVQFKLIAHKKVS